ncbi:MAG: hypothetical protein HUJ26_24185 [Planctomycetaceae bacterium]|nr:hypothetical protein [Planctomycetaceae bacterium]
MRIVLIVICCIGSLSVAHAEDEKLIPIHAFRRKTAPEMVYTIDTEEIARLKRTDGWEDRGILGLGSAKAGENLIKLQRAHRGRWHVFYTKAPAKLPTGTEVEEFDVWVWETEREDLVPVYGTSLPDWRDMVFSTDKAKIKEAVEESWNAAKIKRLDHGVMFYVKPAKPKE